MSGLVRPGVHSCRQYPRRGELRIQARRCALDIDGQDGKDVSCLVRIECASHGIRFTQFAASPVFRHAFAIYIYYVIWE